MRAEESVQINRPLEQVFSYVADPGNRPEWSSVVQEVRKERPGEPKEGDRFTIVSKFLGTRFETPMEVAAHEPPRHHSDRSTGGPFEQEFIYTFEEVVGGGTRFTQVVEAEPGGFFKLAGPLLERAGKRQIRAELGALKDLLEAEQG